MNWAVTADDNERGFEHYRVGAFLWELIVAVCHFVELGGLEVRVGVFVNEDCLSAVGEVLEGLVLVIEAGAVFFVKGLEELSCLTHVRFG